MSRIAKLIVFIIAGLSLIAASHAETKVGGMTLKEAFPQESVAKLVKAVNDDDFKSADKLLQVVDVNATGKEGMTPLLWITMSMSSLELSRIEYLLKAGANPNYRAPIRGTSAMSLAASANSPKLLELLLKYKGNPNLLGPEDDPILFIAVFLLLDKNIDTLLQAGVDINLPDHNRASVAIKAARLGRFDLTYQFLKHGLSYNLQGLAKSTYASHVPADSDAQRWKDKVIEFLKQKEIQYPPAGKN